MTELARKTHWVFRFHSLAAAVVLLICSTQLSHGATVEDAILTVTLENDTIAGTDRHYTHGTRISYLHREDKLAMPASNLLDRALLGLSVEGKRIGFALGQNIYTPRDISVPELISNDRPYGGWLYAGFLLQRNGTEYNGAISVWDTFEFDLGVVGPESFGEEVQAWWHKTWGLTEPRGWDHQLKFEPALLLQLSRSYNLATPGAEQSWGMDLTSTVGAALGNIFTYARGELMARAGFRLTPGFASTTQGTIPSSVTANPAKESRPHEHPLPPWGAFAFAGIEGRAVARNIFLDGNTWRESHSVDKEVFVADLKAGLSVQISAIQLTGTYVYRTREFRLQLDPNQYASISIAYRF